MKLFYHVLVLFLTALSLLGVVLPALFSAQSHLAVFSGALIVIVTPYVYCLYVKKFIRKGKTQ